MSVCLYVHVYIFTYIYIYIYIFGVPQLVPPTHHRTNTKRRNMQSLIGVAVCAEQVRGKHSQQPHRREVPRHQPGKRGVSAAGRRQKGWPRHDDGHWLCGAGRQVGIDRNRRGVA